MSISPFFDEIKANIDRCGLHIFGIAGSKDSPSFTYTVGFAAHGLPEVIVFGINASLIVPYINRYYDEIVNRKTRDAGPGMLVPDDDWFNLPMSVINADQAKASSYAPQAFYFACDMKWDVPNFVQWVWCDPDGKFPWQKGYDRARFEKYQPVLGRFM